MQDSDAKVKKLIRFQALLSGDAKPQTLEDDLFLDFYEDAIMDVNLFDSYLRICDDINVEKLELHAAMTGYSLGQLQGRFLLKDDDEDYKPPTH